MRFIDAVGVLGGNEGGIRADVLRAAVAGPVVDDVGVGAGRGGGASGRTRGSLDRFRSQGDRALARAVGSDGIVDGYIILFPDGEEVIVGLLLIGGNLGGFITINIGIPAVSINKEVSGGTALGLGPALEGVARAGLGAKDVYSLVDLDAGVRLIQRALTFVLRAVVAVPVYVSRSFYFFVYINSLKLNRISVRASWSIGIKLRFRYNSSLTVCNFGISLFYLKCRACQHGSARIHIGSSVPMLQHPVREHLRTIRRSRRRASGC